MEINIVLRQIKLHVYVCFFLAAQPRPQGEAVTMVTAMKAGYFFLLSLKIRTT